MAAAADMHPTDDHSHRFWTYPEWIQANGGRLTEENVLDYFATSMFWDRTSDNQAMKMQMQFSEARPTDIAAELKSRWTGIQFAVVQSDAPTFFLVHKLKRDSPDRTTPLAAYFIMHNRIFQCPDVYNVVANRLLSAFHGLESSLKIIRSHKPEFSPRWGFSWPVDLSGMKAEAQRRAATARASVEPATPAAATPGTPAAQPAGGGVDDSSAAVASAMAGSTKKAVNTMPMFLALSTTTAHSIATLPDLQPVPLIAEEPASTTATAAKPAASSGAVPPAPTTDAAPAPVATTKRKRKRTNAAATPAATPAASG